MRTTAPFRLSEPIGRAALAYFAVVFGVGFLLGTIRVVLIAPVLGDLPAVTLEAPIMLLVSWRACGVTLRMFDIRGPGQAAAMGAFAFALLMSAEMALAVLAFGRSPVQFLQALGAPAGALGLASQVIFGFFPLLRSARR